MGVFRQFPYSNFHEMNMDEIIKIIKNMLEEWATYHAEWDSWMDQMNDDWSNYQDVMNEAWENMQDFINNYFDNLDVQEEINNKIVSMIQTGEFGLLVNEYIPPAVSAWLALHITVPTGVVIDTSLTVAGACADAKVTGDKIRNIVGPYYTSIDKTNDALTQYATEGYIHNDTGEFVPASNYQCYYLTLPVDCNIWVDEATEWTQIAVYDGTIFDTDDLVSIGSLSRNTLPYENSKWSVSAGKKVVICVSNTNFGFHYANGDYLTADQINHIDEVLNISTQYNKLNAITEPEEFTYNMYSPELTLYGTQGYPSSDNGSFNALANYDCYSLHIEHDSEIWFDAAPASYWIQIAVYNGPIFDTTKWLGTYGINRGTLPLEDSKLSVEAGVNIVVCRSNNDFKMHITNDSDFVISNDQIEYFSDKIIRTPITVLKADTNKFRVIVVTPSVENKVIYEFEKYNKTWTDLTYVDGDGVTQLASSVVSADCWNNTKIIDDHGNNIAQGNTNFIVKTMDSNYHCGDGHGNEVIEYIAFLIDGEPLDIESMQNGESVQCSDFRMIQRTKMYKVGGCIDATNEYDTNYPALDTDGNPIVYFKHFMEVLINSNNEVSVNNKLLVMANNISFNQCHGAMLQCNYGDFDEVICNNNEQTRNEISSSGTFTVPSDSTIDLKNTTQKCDSVEMYGDAYYIRQEMHQNDIDRIGKTRVLFFDYTNRLKCYFQPVIADFGKFAGETIETFNTGDAISVSNYRKIEIK